MGTITLTMAAALLSLPVIAAAQQAPQDRSLSQRLDELEKRQKALEERFDFHGPRAFSLKSPDGAFEVHVGGLAQADSRTFLNAESTPSSTPVDQFLVRRARIYLDGVVERYIRFRITPDFASGQSLLQDAWLDLGYTPVFGFTGGKFKEPLGLERLQDDSKTMFIERGLPSDLAPNRDVGVQAHGALGGKTLDYALALLDGAPDGGSADTDSDNHKDVVGRVFLHPMPDAGVGVAGGVGRESGSSSSTGLPSYATEAQRSFFSYSSGVQANGLRRRFAPQAYWYPANFSLLGEYVESSQNMTRTTGARASDDVIVRAWQVAGSWVLTGEKTGFEGVRPRRPFDPAKGAWGAWEVAARYSALWIDAAAFPRFADPTASSRRADAWTAGLNWYLNGDVRLMVDYNQTKLAGGSRDLEQAVLTRMQVSF